jgi:bacterioferritin
MKSDPKIIDMLNDLLADELTAINQYMVHSEMCNHWGYGQLHEAIEARAITEMRHAETLIERILFLEGQPVVSKLKTINIGTSVPEMMRNDIQAENEAVAAYNKGTALAGDLGDESTADMLVEILQMEEDHVDWLEKQLNKIEHVGLQNFLANQARGDEEEE